MKRTNVDCDETLVELMVDFTEKCIRILQLMWILNKESTITPDLLGLNQSSLKHFKPVIFSWENHWIFGWFIRSRPKRNWWQRNNETLGSASCFFPREKLFKTNCFAALEIVLPSRFHWAAHSTFRFRASRTFKCNRLKADELNGRHQRAPCIYCPINDVTSTYIPCTYVAHAWHIWKCLGVTLTDG